MTTKVLPFIANYERELQMRVNIRRKGKVEKVTEFVERMKRVQKEVGAALKKAQKEMRRQADRGRQEVKQKKGKKVMLGTKDLVFKERPVKKLIERYVGPYQNRESSVEKCSKVKATSLNENSFGGKCQQSSEVQRTSKRTEDGGTETSRGRRSKGMESQKDIEQEEDIGDGEIFSKMEGVYSRK